MSDNEKLSRRFLLQGATVLGASATLAACGDDEPPPGPNPDIVVLNRLLTKEYELIGAYTTARMLLASPPMGDPLAAQAIVLSTVFNNWMAQHREHALVLASAVTAIGGTPVTEASVMFTPPASFSNTVRNVLSLSANLEREAAVGLNDAVKNLASAGNRFVAANIQGVQTQHFVVVHVLLRQIAAAGSEIITNIASIVPTPFVVAVTPAPTGGTGTGLSGLTALAYT